MSSDAPEFPWMFYRDEIDLAGDTIDDLYEQFFVKEKEGCFEYLVLHEHMQTEALSDERLSALMGMQVFLHGSSTKQKLTQQWNTQEQFPHDAEQDPRLHPLYQQAKAWSEMVSPFAKRLYEQGGRSIEHLFRVYLYSLCIPMKIFMGVDEEIQEDPSGPKIALEEFDLAITYLRRVLESLTHIPFHVDEFDWLHLCRSGAHELISHLSQTIESLQGRGSRLV